MINISYSKEVTIRSFRRYEIIQYQKWKHSNFVMKSDIEPWFWIKEVLILLRKQSRTGKESSRVYSKINEEKNK